VRECMHAAVKIWNFHTLHNIGNQGGSEESVAYDVEEVYDTALLVLA